VVRGLCDLLLRDHFVPADPGGMRPQYAVPLVASSDTLLTRIYRLAPGLHPVLCLWQPSCRPRRIDAMFRRLAIEGIAPSYP